MLTALSEIDTEHAGCFGKANDAQVWTLVPSSVALALLRVPVAGASRGARTTLIRLLAAYPKLQQRYSAVAADAESSSPQ
jgi:hypothetical protein